MSLPQFNAEKWLLRLHERESCIIAQWGKNGDREYFWLADDGQGNPTPFSLLNDGQKNLFRARVAIEAVPTTRGLNWWFHCPLCAEKSFFTLRNSYCPNPKCCAQFDEDMKQIRPAPRPGAGRPVAPAITVIVGGSPYPTIEQQVEELIKRGGIVVITQERGELCEGRR